MTTRFIKWLALALAIVAVDIIALSPAFLGIVIGGDAFQTALGITLLLAGAMALLYFGYVWLFKPRHAAPLPVKQIVTRDDYIAALQQFRGVRTLSGDIALSLEQIDRLQKKRDTLIEVLDQRFERTELSYRKFVSVAGEVEKLFFLNIRSILNRLQVFDEAEYLRVMNASAPAFSTALQNEKRSVYGDYIAFVKSSLGANEEMLLKLDKLLLELSRLDSIEPGELESMPCLQEIDALIKQTKLYKS
ncbi:hypothetical protein [Paenibacillus cymbidii]|uniref:hypothetical protein n=1 Tax=Paenibacillus cymbidii TaxID=1639034 RepID=UPI0010802CCD|nr:hypothetical protein [Paenibacillus cymbidii]